MFCSVLIIWPKNTKESILSDCDKPYHKIKENMPLGEELENLWNYPFHPKNSCISRVKSRFQTPPRTMAAARRKVRHLPLRCRSVWLSHAVVISCCTYWAWHTLTKDVVVHRIACGVVVDDNQNRHTCNYAIILIAVTA